MSKSGSEGSHLKVSIQEPSETSAQIRTLRSVYPFAHTFMSTWPNPWLIFTAWLPDFRKLFYLSFSTNISNRFWRIKCSRIWSSAQDHAVLVLLLNIFELLISAWSIMIRRKYFVPFRYQLPKDSKKWIFCKILFENESAGPVCVCVCVSLCVCDFQKTNRRGRPFNIFTLFIGSGGHDEMIFFVGINMNAVRWLAAVHRLPK